MAGPLIHLKNSWAGGEVSPMLYGRTDLQKYPSWSKTLKNMICGTDGSASNRAGTHYMATAKFDGKKCRVRKFVFSTEQAYQLEIGEYYMRFFQVTDSSVAAGQIQRYTTWVTATAYIVGDIVKDGTTYYYCITAHTASAAFATDSAKWEVTNWDTSHAYLRGDYTTHTGVMYYCEISHTSGTFADDVAAGKFVARTLLEIPTPYTEANLTLLKFTQSADILFIAHPDYTTKMLIRSSATHWAIENYNFIGGPFQLPNTEASILLSINATSGLAKTLTASAKAWVTATAYQVGDYVTNTSVYQCILKHTSSAAGATGNEPGVGDVWATCWVVKPLVVFKATHAPLAATTTKWPYVGAGALFQMRHYVEGQKVTSSASETTTSIKCGGTWRVISHGTWTGSFKVQKSTDNGVTWTVLREFTGVDDFNVDTYGTEDMSDNAEPFLVRLIVVETSGAITVDLTTDAFYQSGIAQVTAYSSATVVTVDVKRTFAATTATDDWDEGSWSDYRGWPAVVEFSPQDRLILANTYTEPQTFWMTKTGNYYDFSRGSPLSDSDGITINLPSREVNGINNLVPLTALLALTSSSEWSIGDPGTILTPTSAEQRVNGYEGSSGIDVVTVGNRAVYVQAMGSIVRDMGYELSSYSFTGAILSTLADHLFFGYTILDIDFSKYPERVIWCVRSDGKLLCLTYLREQEIAAWSWGDTGPSGADSFESVSVAPADGYDEVWFVVKRGTARYIERLDRRLASSDTHDQFFMDCGITYSGAAATTITDLSHLEGKTVAVLADGAVLTQKVVASGAITISPAAALVHVGLPYVSDMETLNTELALRDGSAQGRKMQISQFVLGVYKSQGGWIGMSFDELFKIRDSFVTNYGTAATLYTGELKDTIKGGLQDGARVCIRQIDPLPITLRYITGSASPGGMSGV